MKKYFLFLTCLLACLFSFSQDVIVTSEGDTIACKITRVEGGFIHFSVYDNDILLLKSRLPQSKIKHYTIANPELKSENVSPIKKEEEVLFEEIIPTDFRLSFNAGFTYQIEGYDGYPLSYKNQLQTLWHLGGDIHFFMFDNNFGLGVKYNRVQTKANEDFEPPFNGAFGFTKLRDEEVIFRYLAASLLYRHYLIDDQVLNFSLAVGSLKYSAGGLADGRSFYEEGKTVGISLGMSYDFIFIQHLGIGLGIETNIGRLDEITKNGVSYPVDFGISRIDFTLGFRLY